MDNNAVLKAALEYIERGWFVFPIHSIDDDGNCTCGNLNCEDKGKHPKIGGGAKKASRDEEKIREWFADPLTNIAILTGEKSNLTVLDIDIGEKGGDQTWRELNEKEGEPQTLISNTGSGGMHFLFQYNSALNTSSNTLGDGVDCRNDGGYIIAPPSRHKSGNSYSWEDENISLKPLPKHLSKRKEKRGRPKKDDPTRKRYTIEQVEGMLEHIQPDDRDVWRKVGIILGREFNLNEKAWELYNKWSDSWSGRKGRNHDKIMNEAFYEISQQGGDLSMGTIVRFAIDNGWAPKTGQIPPEHFLYFAPGNNFIYRPVGSFWPAESVDSSCSAVNNGQGSLIKPSIWLKQNRLVTSMTSDPIITEEVSQGFDSRDGIIVPAQGAALYNNYRPPNIEPGDSKLAKPWIDHCRKVFNKEGDADQFFDYMAHRVQNPGEKPRFALIIAGEQGVGKDTAISMCGPAMGAWNVSSIEADDLDSNYNEYVASVLVVISEAANAHDMSKWVFNERVKVLIAGNPDYTKVNPKYGQKFSVRLHCGVIITTNHLVSGLYIPEDDRRYDVIDCATRGEMGELADPVKRGQYFEDFWEWYNNEQGAEHITAFLQERDLSNFKAATGQRRTKAHQEVVRAGMSQDEWLLDAMDELGNPPVVRSTSLWEVVKSMNEDGGFNQQKFNRQISNAISRLGFTQLISNNRKDGRFTYQRDGKNVNTKVFYKPDEITPADAFKRWDEKVDQF